MSGELSPWTRRFRRGSVALIAGAFVAIGVVHFVNPEPFVAIMPPFIPWKLGLVYVSGVFEILGGLGVALRPTRRMAAWGLMALLVAVFPANIYHAVGDIEVAGMQMPLAYHLVRLPMQLVLIAWVYQLVRWERRPA